MSSHDLQAHLLYISSRIESVGMALLRDKKFVKHNCAVFTRRECGDSDDGEETQSYSCSPKRGLSALLTFLVEPCAGDSHGW